MPVLEIIIASTRPIRIGTPIATWFVERANAHAGFDVRTTDLAELGLPFLDEPKHPRMREYVHQHTKDWSATIDAADAFVVVTPEYNHSFNGPLKNAFDYLNAEWQHKPLGFVSYGGVSGGTRAVQAFEPVAVALGMAVSNVAVNLAFVFEQLQDDIFQPNDINNEAAKNMLDHLVRMDATLRPLRAA
jgi:NAD(P)H-dependent FMN reductase